MVPGGNCPIGAAIVPYNAEDGLADTVSNRSESISVPCPGNNLLALVYLRHNHFDPPITLPFTLMSQLSEIVEAEKPSV
jgi:hypothetical protein